jgi:3'5'-cyclic nucleotide phosphodiesterase
MGCEYSAFREAACPSRYEMGRPRQLVVNSVIATDVMDNDLKEERNVRWEEAFAPSAEASSESQVVCRRATLVLEHLIQASDVSHCMQHCHVYRKWNDRLFREMRRAYYVAVELESSRFLVPRCAWFLRFLKCLAYRPMSFSTMRNRTERNG